MRGLEISNANLRQERKTIKAKLLSREDWTIASALCAFIQTDPPNLASSAQLLAAPAFFFFFSLSFLLSKSFEVVVRVFLISVGYTFCSLQSEGENRRRSFKERQHGNCCGSQIDDGSPRWNAHRNPDKSNASKGKSSRHARDNRGATSLWCIRAKPESQERRKAVPLFFPPREENWKGKDHQQV